MRDQSRPRRRATPRGGGHPVLAPVLKDQRPMGIGQERVDSIVDLVESEGMGTGLGPYHLKAPHPARLEHFDQPWFPYGHVEMPPDPVEEDDIRHTAKLSPRQLNPRPGIKHD